MLLHSFKAYLSCCLLALQDCFGRRLHSVLLGGQYASGMPVHLRRPPRADANDALAMLSPILRLFIDEYITLSAIEPFNDPTGWYLGLLLIVFSKRLSSYDTVTLCLDSISLIALSNFFLSLNSSLIMKDTCEIYVRHTAWFPLGVVFSARFSG